MKKRVFAMLLAMAMVFSLMACGSKDKTGGSDGDTIRLGGVGPLTGGYANYGLSVQHGAELAAKEINAAGGVNGKMLEVQFQDSQGDPESAVAAYGKLMDWGMNVSLGAVLSGETASVVAAAKADDMFIMETTGSADKCIDGNDKAAVMTSLTVEGVTGTMTWSADGNTNKAASAILYKNGVGSLFGGQKADSAAE